MLKGRRDSAAIATKVGPRDDPRTSLESSLRRLDTGHVELLQLHEVAEGFEQRLEAMTRLMEEGKASAIGMCNAGAHQLAQGLSVAPLSTCQSPYNLFDRDVEHRDLEFCGEHGLAFLAYRPLAAGLLGGRLGGEDPPDFEEGDHRRRIYWFKGAEWERRHSVAERLRPLAADLGLGLPALALGWVLAQPGVSVAIAGARTAGQVDENLSILGRPLDPEHVKAIDSAVAEVFRPAKAGEAALAAASGWGERERFIVEHLDGRTTADGIARQWPEWEERPLITAQVKVFVDSLVEQGLVSYER